MADSGRGQRFGPVAGRVAIAALVTACDPVLVWQSRSVMTETPRPSWWRRHWPGCACRDGAGPILGGLGFGLAALCRPSLLAGAVLTILAALVGPTRATASYA